MLSYDQAVNFLEGTLGMPSSWRELVYKKPLEFLTLYIKRHAVRIPFQNMHLAAVDLDKRWFPTEQDVVTTGLSGLGGCCLHLNYFTKLVFQAIGLNTFAVRGDHYRAWVPGSHCMVMVNLEGPQEHGIYMVEVGGAYPMLEPVPMFGLPYRTLQAGGFYYEYRDIGKGHVGKFHIGGGLMGGAFDGFQETLRTSWDLKPRGFWEFEYGMLEVFTNRRWSTLLQNPMMYRFFTNKEFRQLFPQLPENQEYTKAKKILTSNREALSKIGKVLAANGKTKTSTASKAKLNEGNAKNLDALVAPVKSFKSGPANGTATGVLTATNGKTPISITTAGSKTLSSKLKNVLIEESESDEEFEVVTEEEVESEDDGGADPKNFIFVWKRRLVIGDAHSRKIVKNYDSYEKMGEDLQKYFPTIPKAVVCKAMLAFTEFEPVNTALDSIL